MLEVTLKVTARHYTAKEAGEDWEADPITAKAVVNGINRALEIFDMEFVIEDAQLLDAAEALEEIA